MGEGNGRIFTLAEANEVVARLSRYTSQVVLKIQQLRERYGLQEDETELPETALQEVEELLGDWSAMVEGLGAQPKGYFTADFQSAEPGMLYCWTFGEDEIGYTHKVWENFTQRRPLIEGPPLEGEHLKWVN
ncbi:MAG: DUF2203 family protein [Acidobacteria bacterium]|nr:DUF2203 family protein [Acidobacteriota bacterium]